jgi:hypothetical protein
LENQRGHPKRLDSTRAAQPVAGTALFVLGAFFIVMGVGTWGMAALAPHNTFGPDPSQMSWGINQGAAFVGVGIFFLGLG